MGELKLRQLCDGAFAASSDGMRTDGVDVDGLRDYLDAEDGLRVGGVGGVEMLDKANGGGWALLASLMHAEWDQRPTAEEALARSTTARRAARRVSRTRHRTSLGARAKPPPDISGEAAARTCGATTTMAAVAGGMVAVVAGMVEAAAGAAAAVGTRVATHPALRTTMTSEWEKTW